MPLGWFCLKPTIDSIASHVVKYFCNIFRTCPFILSNTTVLHSSSKFAGMYVYKSNTVIILMLAGVIEHSVPK